MTDSLSKSSRRTGSWVVRSTDCGYLTAAGVGGHAFGQAPDALVFPTKTAAREAMRGYARAADEEIVIERSYGHEERHDEVARRPHD